MPGHRLLAVAVLACVATPANAAVYTVWQGEAVITAASAACSTGVPERVRIAQGTVLKSVVRPRLVPGSSNGNDSRIAFIRDVQAEMALDLAAGLAYTGTTGSYAAYGVAANGVFKTNVGGTYGPMAVSPAGTPTTATTYLHLSGKVNDFMFIPGCTVSFRAGYSLRP